MGCRILHDSRDGYTAFYCSTTMTAFGPVMGSLTEAEAFLKYIDPADPRNYSAAELATKHTEFVMAMVCECGVVREVECEFCDLEETPLESDGVHRWSEEYARNVTKKYAEKCGKDPEPEPGERFQCGSCKAKKGKHGPKSYS